MLYNHISATDLSQWADRREAQEQLPALLRRLIHSSGIPVKAISFPSGDSVLIGGHDGKLETEEGNAWMPVGRSLWEMGSTSKIKGKADSDYQKRTKELSEDERRKTCFVFVTPRRWSNKTKWLADRRAEGAWGDVRCLDADDLEQWIEVSPVVQTWLTQVMGRPLLGFVSGETFWAKWSEVTNPPLPRTLLLGGREALVEDLLSLIQEPRGLSITVAADSRDEAIAFVCAAMHDRQNMLDRLVIIEDGAEVDPKLWTGNPIFVFATPGVQMKYAALAHRFSVIIPVSRGQAEQEYDFDLAPLSGEQFEKGIADWNLSEHDLERIERECGRSVTILRRTKAITPALKTPAWSGDTDAARKLVPFALCGAWSWDASEDLRTLAQLANLTEEDIERHCVDLLRMEDTPLEVIGPLNRLVSHKDALFAVAPRVTRHDLDRFFTIAKQAFDVRDPALDLPEDQQWMSNVVGKRHPFSGAFLRGLGNTLILLAVYGDKLFGHRLNMSVEAEVHRLVSSILRPLDGNGWLSIRGNLRLLAEASPSAFLEALERDLATPSPGVMALMPVVRGAMGGDCRRTELLWALELLGWSQDHFPRVVDILAQLSRIRLEDNWGNKPAASLEILIRPWPLNTNASLNIRIAALSRLFSNDLETAFKITMAMISSYRSTISNSIKPRWRDYAANAGRPVLRREIFDMCKAAVSMALSLPFYSFDRVVDLIENINNLRPEDQVQIWDIVSKWSEGASDTEKSDLHEFLRRRISRRKRQGQDFEAFEAVFQALEPSAPELRYRWLFMHNWVDWSADELDGAEDYGAREKRIERTRLQALRGVLAQGGDEALLRFALSVGSPGLVGDFMARFLWVEFPPDKIVSILNNHTSSPELRAFRRGLMFNSELGKVFDIINIYESLYLSGELTLDGFVDILCDAPDKSTLWEYVDALGEAVSNHFWARVPVGWGLWSDEEACFVVERLLAAQRPRSAFSAIRPDKKQIPTEMMLRVLEAIMTGQEAEAKLPESYDIEGAFNFIDMDTWADPKRIIALEIQFSGALLRSERGLRTLYTHLKEMPELYIQMIASIYTRNDDGYDPAEWRIESPEMAQEIGRIYYRILNEWNLVQEFTKNGIEMAEELNEWINKSRGLAGEVARADIVDRRIGEMLGATHSWRGSAWPTEPVCQILEVIDSPRMYEGFHVGVRNSRGVTSRNPFEGGKQERQLASEFDLYAKALEVQWPKVAAVIRNLASSYRREAEREDQDARRSQIHGL